METMNPDKSLGTTTRPRKKYFSLFALFFRLGAIQEAEYRANFVLHSIETLMSLATGLSVLWVVTSQAEVIGGWGWNGLLVVFGLWFVVGGLVNMVVAPSIRQFMHDIWLGNLDFLLVKPQNHQLLASARKVMIFQVVDIAIGLVVLGTGLSRLGATIGLEEAVKFATILAAGAVILYSFWVVLGTLAIWTVKLENLMLVFFSMFEAGRWPAGLYPFWLKYSLTFLVPIVFAITMPAEAILGELPWSSIGLAVGWAVIFFLVSRKFFDYGVRYKYMGASA